jgi:citrate synthase
MGEGRIKTNIDYHVLEEDALGQYINLTKYNSPEGKWESLEKIFTGDLDFIDLLYIKLIGQKPLEKERKLLLKTLMISSFGTGCHPQSVMVPKLIASTTKNKDFAIINGLIGGLATFGTDHLGAVSNIMETSRQIRKNSSGRSIEDTVEEYVALQILNGDKIRGFGHPVYKRDPRPSLLAEEVEKVYPGNIYAEIYGCLSKILFEKKKIYPNIDSALALSYNNLGFEPEQGIYLSFISRSLSMICHILEEIPKKPFSFLNELVSMGDFCEDKDQLRV